MSRTSVKSPRNLLFGVMLLFLIVGFGGISATVVKMSPSAVILVLVAFAEAGLMILGLVVQNEQEGSVGKPENVQPNVTVIG